MPNKSHTHITLHHWWNFRLKVFAEGIFVGFLVGLMIVLFRFLLEKADYLRNNIYIYLHNHTYPATILWFAILIGIAWIVGLIVKKEPLTGGSGIPQVKGVLLRQIKMNWLRVIIGKFIGGVLAIGAGLSLGREGPSVQLGAAVGQGLSRTLGRLNIEEKYLITCGASAGLAAAFNAPLAGVVFALEEMHKNFSSVVLTSTIGAAVTADFVSQKFFGQQPVFNFHGLPDFPLNYYFYLIVLGIIIGAFGVLFNRTLLKSLDLFSKINWLPKTFIPAIPLLIGGILGFSLPQTLSGGHELIATISQGQWGLKMLVLLIIVKFLFTMISFGSGVPGGIFLPLLVIGALTGDLYGNTLTSLLHLNPIYINNFAILAMAAYFTAIVKAPVTGSILITEMTGSFTHLLPLITISMTAYLVSDLLKGTPIYDDLLQRALKNKNGHFVGNKDRKYIIEIAVCLGSTVDGKMIKDITWPAHCLLVGVKRGETEIIPKGNTRIYAGDYLIVLTNEEQAAQVRKSLGPLAGECIN